MRTVGFLVLACCAWAQDRPSEKCAIAGTVVSSVTGEPLRKVAITAESFGPGPGHVLVTTSDASGHFSLDDVPRGKYTLKGRRSGFLETYYGANRARSRGTPITLEAGQSVKDLQFKLMPYGVIAGTVRDPDGDPMDKVTVVAFRSQFERGHRKLSEAQSADTDDMGQFRMIDLEPGRYFLRADPPRTDAWRAENVTRPLQILVPTLYPGVQDADAAQGIDVEAGARMAGIDFVLPRRTTVPVSGHVTGVPGAESPRVFLFAGNSGNENSGSGGIGFDLEAKMEANGNFQFTGVPAATYTLTASAELPRKPTTDMFDLMLNENRYTAQASLQVADTPVRNVQIAIEPGAEVTGHVTLEGEKEKTVSGIQVVFDGGGERPIAGAARDGATFSVALPRGHYNIDHQTGAGIVKSVQLDGRDIFEDGLTITGPGKLPLEIVVTKTAGEVDGAVVDKDGMPVPGATVVLIPEARLRTHPDLFLQVQADQAGRYEIKGVPPGNYKVFSWDDVEPGIWWDPDFLRGFEAKGEAVKVSAEGREEVPLHLLSANSQ